MRGHIAILRKGCVCIPRTYRTVSACSIKLIPCINDAKDRTLVRDLMGVYDPHALRIDEMYVAIGGTNSQQTRVTEVGEPA